MKERDDEDNVVRFAMGCKGKGFGDRVVQGKSEDRSSVRVGVFGVDGADATEIVELVFFDEVALWGRGGKVRRLGSLGCQC